MDRGDIRYASRRRDLLALKKLSWRWIAALKLFTTTTIYIMKLDILGDCHASCQMGKQPRDPVTSVRR
jgi:hypothetical protein